MKQCYPIIAIDGAAATGKGLLARGLSRHYGFAWLDSGLLYRAVAKKHADGGGDMKDEETVTATARLLTPADLNDPLLRKEQYGSLASLIAAYENVRSSLLSFQHSYAAHLSHDKKGLVVDGRDIGSVVFPDTDYKIFLKASLEIRYRRRLIELQNRGFQVIASELRQTMIERDSRDNHRSLAPLICSDDAFVVDCTTLSGIEVFEKVCRWLESKGLDALSCLASSSQPRN